MAMRNFFPIRFIRNTVQRGLGSYHAKYIQTSSVEPLYHICFGGMILSYLVALPEELRHLKHQEKHGGSGTH